MKRANGRTRQYLNDLLGLDTLGVPEAQVKAAINQSLMHYLPFMYVTVALFFIAYAVLQAFFLQEPGAGLMVTVALASAFFMLAGAWGLRRGAVELHLAELVTAVGAALVFGSVVLRAQLTADPKQAANLALFLFAMAIIFISPAWYAFFSLITLGALLLAYLTFPYTADWPYFIVVTVAAMATGFLAHVVRVRAYRHAVVLRIVEEQQRQQLEQRTLQLQTAVGVGQHITSILDFDQLMGHIAGLICDRYGAYFVGVFLPDAGGLRLTAVAQAGQGRATPLPPVEVSLGGCIGWVMQHGEPLCIDNVLQETRFVPAEATPHTQSELALPLKKGEQILGVLDLQSNRSMAFAREDLPAYQLLADQVAIALENARLYEAIKQLNQELEQKVRDRTRALQEAYGRLERLDRTKTDFITIASHELRTPLTIVNFNSQMFLEDDELGQNSVYRGWAEGIHRGVMRMEAVVENILDVAKIDSRSLELFPSPLNLRFLVQQVVQRIERSLDGRDLTFTVAEMNGLPEIEADAEAMEKMFYHLLVNAVKYTPDGGFIRVDGRVYRPAANGDGGQQAVEIIVADTGIGIAPEVQDLIFEKFYQTGPVQFHSSGHTSFRGGGSGIGLAIARGIVGAHNGRIWVESAGFNEKECPGSAFHIVLPVRQPTLAVNEERSMAAGQRP